MPPETLLRPLSSDVLSFLTPLLIGLGAYLLGRYFKRLSLAVRVSLVGLTVAAIFVVMAMLFQAMPRPVEVAFSYVGGVIIVLCWMILAVIGYSWATPNPSSDFFARFFLALMPVALIAVESGGSLWFRFINTEPWKNRPSAANWGGRMVQTTKMTCLPVSAAMLLDSYGLVDKDKDDFDFSEGELAYLANTSFFGSDGHVMARAMTQKIKLENPDGKATMYRATFDEMVERGAPFIAEVQLDNVGKHAVLIITITKHILLWIDPLVGEPQNKNASEFESVWTGNVIVIEGVSRPMKNPDEH
jgi:hypothetical protein